MDAIPCAALAVSHVPRDLDLVECVVVDEALVQQLGWAYHYNQSKRDARTNRRDVFDPS